MTRPSLSLTAVILLVSSSAFSSQAPARPRPKNLPQRPTVAPTVPASASVDDSRHRAVITKDGAIETTLSDGSKRITRPGVCGWTTIMPDGTKSTVACMQVQPATPALPDQIGSRWLDAHNEYLLDIARALLGNDQTSIDNYLRNNETAQQTVYDRIWVRTDLISKLTEPH